MITFDRVLPELLRVCHEAPSHDAVARYCVVRDVRGRVRLVVEPKKGARLSEEALQSALAAALDGYFVGPVLSAANGGEVERLARRLLEMAKGKWPAGWPRSFQNLIGAADTSISVETQWTGIERTLSKEAWLTTAPPAPPWPLVRGKTPPIVSFHSFKGGVGRSTLLATYAIRLASEPSAKRVAVVDLDLEAPGLGSLLGATTERGVLDVLIDQLATGQIDLAGASIQAGLGNPMDQRLTVFPAGRLDDLYLQKLARLDYSSTEPGGENPVGVALRAMLEAMKADFDVILLDSRAGLHDLAGMSLHGLAHVDVLVFRGTEQNLTGLGQTLRTLDSRGTAAQLVLVETLLPAEKEQFEFRQERTRPRVYDLLLQHIYPETDPPQRGDSGEPHDVVFVKRKESLDLLDSFRDHLADVMNDGEFGEVARRIDDGCELYARRTAGGAGDKEDAE